MDNKLNETKELIAEKLDLPRNIILDLPKITVTGDSEIIIENHKGIVAFHEKEVKVNSNAGLISVHGEGFEIRFIGGSTITLHGHFKSIEYER